MALNGDEAVALAAKQCDVDVVAAYPITPKQSLWKNSANTLQTGKFKQNLSAQNPSIAP